jgi:hypothetical protein
MSLAKGMALSAARFIQIARQGKAHFVIAHETIGRAKQTDCCNGAFLQCQFQP